MSGNISSLVPYYINFGIFAGAIGFLTRGKLTSALFARRSKIINDMVRNKVDLNATLLTYNDLLNQKASFAEREKQRRREAEISLQKSLTKLRDDYKRKNERIEQETKAIIARVERDHIKSLVLKLVELSAEGLNKEDLSHLFTLSSKIKVECQADGRP